MEPHPPPSPSWASGLTASTCVLTDVVVLEVSSSLAQPSLFYHLGVRESFSMTNNVLLCSQADLPDLQALRVGGQVAGRGRHRTGVMPTQNTNICLFPTGGCFPEELGEQNLPLTPLCPLVSIMTSDPLTTFPGLLSYFWSPQYLMTSL